MLELAPALAEKAHVGVAEAVDRLELVADREQVLALERAQDRELAGVGVLELVDHQQLEALGPRAAQRRRGRRADRARISSRSSKSTARRSRLSAS